MINKEITQEQLDKISLYQDKYLKLRTKTEPIDQDKVRAVLKKLLDLYGEEALFDDDEIVFTDKLPEKSYGVLSGNLYFILMRFITKFVFVVRMQLASYDNYKQAYHLSYYNRHEMLDVDVAISALYSSCMNVSFMVDMSFLEFAIEEKIVELDTEMQTQWQLLNELGQEVYFMEDTGSQIVCYDRPEKILIENGKLHSEDSHAVELRSGDKVYYWNGVRVPEQLILKPETITQEDILKETNAEVRRCYMERLTLKVYYDILTQGEGLTLLNETVDGNNNVMRLWQTTKKDDILNKKVQFLECVCPSTLRVYNLYTPSQKAKTCLEAKNNTFSDTLLTYRHGDVGLRRLGKTKSKKTKIEIET